MGVKSTVRDYYRVAVPGDLEQTIEALKEHAINEARERARLYCVPCHWRATHVSGEVGGWEVVFRVCRTRNRVPKVVA